MHNDLRLILGDQSAESNKSCNVAATSIADELDRPVHRLQSDGMEARLDFLLLIWISAQWSDFKSLDQSKRNEYELS